ncbi:MAG: hypothetical protein WKF40_11400 [Thermoleophilaceae bacterium]
MGFRVALNVTDSNVIDVGYAGVVGADRIADGDPLYGPGFSEDVERGDTYGPVDYLSYVPFEQAMPWSGAWDDLPAAHGAAIAFDLLTLAGLILLGMRLRAGPPGRELGLALGFAWAAYPYALFALETNSNDSLVGLFTVLAMLALTLGPARSGASAAARGAAVAPGHCGQVRPRGPGSPVRGGDGEGPKRLRAVVVFAAATALVLVAAFAPFVPERRCGRALRPYGRIPGVPAVALLDLGAGRVASTGSRLRSRPPPACSPCWSPSCPGAATPSR